MDDIIKNTTFPRRWSFRELDFFSGGTSVKIKSDERVKSVLGAIITLVIYVILGYFIHYFLSDFLDTTKPKTQINTQLLENASTFKANDTSLGGIYIFFLVSNPSLDAGKTEPYYLSYDTIKSYYDYQSLHEDLVYEIDGLVTKKVQSKSRNVTLGKCSETKWFKSSQFQVTTKNTPFMKFVIENFAICPLFEEGMDIFGDDQSLKSARYKFTLSPCTDPNTCSGVFSSLTGVSDQSVIVGAFQPVIKTSEKDNPFSYEVNLNNLVPIGLMLNSKVILSLKANEVETDKGWVVSDPVTESKAGINEVRLTYDPVVTVGDLISDPFSESLNFGVKYVGNEPPLSIRIVSSRLKTQLSRSYSTIPELIGNIGGTIEVVVMVFLLCLHWIQNLLQKTRTNFVVGRHLNLPPRIRPSQSLTMSLYYKCCKKRNKDLAFKAQSSEVVGEIVDKALSIEQMSCNQIMLGFFLENSFPDEIRQLVPVVHVMKKLLEHTPKENLCVLRAASRSECVSVRGAIQVVDCQQERPYSSKITGGSKLSHRIISTRQDRELALINLPKEGYEAGPQNELELGMSNSPVPDETRPSQESQKQGEPGQIMRMTPISTEAGGVVLRPLELRTDTSSPESLNLSVAAEQGPAKPYTKCAPNFRTQNANQDNLEQPEGKHPDDFDHFTKTLNTPMVNVEPVDGMHYDRVFTEADNSDQNVDGPTLAAYRRLIESCNRSSGVETWKRDMLETIHQFAHVSGVDPPEKLFAGHTKLGFLGKLTIAFGAGSTHDLGRN